MGKRNTMTKREKELYMQNAKLRKALNDLMNAINGVSLRYALEQAERAFD